MRTAVLPPCLVGRGALPPEIEWRLLDSLFGQTASFYSGAAGMLLVGLVWWARTRSPWPLAWIALSGTITVVRLLLARAYRNHSRRGQPRTWARRFAIGACATASLWGAASAVVVMEPDPFIHFLVITVQIGYLAGAAARNNASPAAALGQVFLTLIPLLIACIATGNVYYTCYTAFVVLYVFAAIATIRFLSNQTVRLLLADEEKAALVRQVSRANDDLAAANRRLEDLAATDGLTGLINRRAFDVSLSREWYRAARNQGPLSLIMLDIDFFKQFNDRYGHLGGDDCLKMVARATGGTARRTTDLVARYGGEEFAVLLPNTDEHGAGELAERIRQTIEALGIPHSLSCWQRVTVSIGVATMTPNPRLESEDLVRMADTELYRAKEDGRNRVRTGCEEACGFDLTPPIAANQVDAPERVPSTGAD